MTRQDRIVRRLRELGARRVTNEFTERWKEFKYYRLPGCPYWIGVPKATQPFWCNSNTNGILDRLSDWEKSFAASIWEATIGYAFTRDE